MYRPKLQMIKGCIRVGRAEEGTSSLRPELAALHGALARLAGVCFLFLRFRSHDRFMCTGSQRCRINTKSKHQVRIRLLTFVSLYCLLGVLTHRQLISGSIFLAHARRYRPSCGTGRLPTGSGRRAYPPSPPRSPIHAGRPRLPGHPPFVGRLRPSGLRH